MPAPVSPAALVDEYLRLLMLPDPTSARRFVAPDLHIRFAGGRAMRDPAETSAFNAQRYRWVKKRIDATETVAGGTPERTVVYSLGTLYGEWPDGTSFEGNRYVDRYVVRHGLIAEMELPLVMGIALHPYLMGQPYRLRHLRRALQHIAAARDDGDVWLTTPGAICHHVDTAVP